MIICDLALVIYDTYQEITTLFDFNTKDSHTFFESNKSTYEWIDLIEVTLNSSSVR